MIPAQLTFSQRLTTTAALVDAALTERRAAGQPTRDLDLHARELAFYLDVERQAERRRVELGT